MYIEVLSIYMEVVEIIKKFLVYSAALQIVYGILRNEVVFIMQL